MEENETNGLLSNIKGNASEKFIISKLCEEGYKVRKTVRKGIKIKDGKVTTPFVYLNNVGIKYILKDYNGDKKEIEQMFKENLKGLPDFICLRRGAISFVEVKSNASSLTEEQESVITLLKSKGFNVDIRRVKVDLSLTEIK